MKEIILLKSVFDEVQALISAGQCCDSQLRCLMTDMLSFRSFGRYPGAVYKSDVLFVLRRRISLSDGCCRDGLCQLYTRIAGKGPGGVSGGQG